MDEAAIGHLLGETLLAPTPGGLKPARDQAGRHIPVLALLRGAERHDFAKRRPRLAQAVGQRIHLKIARIAGDQPQIAVEHGEPLAYVGERGVELAVGIPQLPAQIRERALNPDLLGDVLYRAPFAGQLAVVVEDRFTDLLDHALLAVGATNPILKLEVRPPSGILFEHPRAIVRVDETLHGLRLGDAAHVLRRNAENARVAFGHDDRVGFCVPEPVVEFGDALRVLQMAQGFLQRPSGPAAFGDILDCGNEDRRCLGPRKLQADLDIVRRSVLPSVHRLEDYLLAQALT